MLLKRMMHRFVAWWRCRKAG